MKLASFLRGKAPSWGIVEGDEIADLGALWGDTIPDLRALISTSAWREVQAAAAEAPRVRTEAVEWLPVIPNPPKILCVGLNYESHRREAGRSEVAHPTIFARFANSQTGHLTSIVRPQVSRELDYEGELAVVIGRGGRYIPEADALAHVAGYSCYNDGSVRDWQRHTHQFTPGKNFPETGAFGPWLVTADEIADLDALHLSTRVNGATVQQAGLDQMIFGVPRIIAYCSAFTCLEPGDVIATGTPGGVGFKREPLLFLKPGDTVEVEITGIGTLINSIADEDPR
jgi:2-keto-4-pentenoate hydratase/2-oxohepta-3-ene-1,7-dioic acid hydratase in catechol pathway